MNRTALIANATETRTMETTTRLGEVVQAVHVPEYWVSTDGRTRTITTDIERARNVARNYARFHYPRDEVKIARRWLAVSRAA